MFNSTHVFPSPDMLLCLIFLPRAVNTRDVCTCYLCTSFRTIDMSCSEQNIPHSHDLATKLSWPEISREVATAFPFGENQELYNFVLNSLVPGFALLYHFSLSVLRVCLRACVQVRCGIMCDCVCGNGYTVIYYTFCIYFCLNTVR